MKIHHLTLLALLPIAPLSAQLSVLEGPPGQAGDVVVLSTPEARPVELQGILLMPLDCVGRTALNELLPDLPRHLTDVPGAARLVLPNERGSLYKFKRRDAGALAFGYFLVLPSGEAQSLFELPGTGSLGAVDPLPEKVAVAADGSAVLVSSTPAAGGDLYELDLVRLSAINHTSQVPPLAFHRNGLVLLDTWGLGVADDGVHRFERTATGRADTVTLSPPPRSFGPDVVSSADASTVAFLAGDNMAHALVWTCGRFGPATQASDRAMPIPGAGFLPEDETGPALALSTDGSWVAWRTEGSSRECFVRETRAGTRPTDLQVTGPANFDNTLNDTGVIAFFDPDSAVLVTGRRDGAGIGHADLYRIDLSSQGLSASNLSQTSGILQPPFDYGELRTAEGLFRLPPAVAASAPAYVVFNRSARRLGWVEGAGGLTEVLGRVDALASISVVGSYLVAGVTRSPGVDDPVLQSLNLVQVPAGGLNPVVVRLPNGCHLTREVSTSARGVYAAVLEFSNGERLGRLGVPSPAGVTISPALLTFGPTVGMSQDGAVFATVRAGLDVATFAWSDITASILRLQRGDSFVLPSR